MIPLYKPYMPDLPELNTILHSGRLAAGEYTLSFEGALRTFLQEQNILATNTFSSAVSVAAGAIGLKSGDCVILSPMACLMSTQSFKSLGLDIIWADVDPRTGTLDPKSVKERITSNV